MVMMHDIVCLWVYTNSSKSGEVPSLREVRALDDMVLPVLTGLCVLIMSSCESRRMLGASRTNIITAQIFRFRGVQSTLML